MGRRPGRHRWVQGACGRCGLHRQELWVLDADQVPVTAVAWLDRTGAVRVQVFPPMKVPRPDLLPTTTAAQHFPGVPQGPEPPCVDRG